MEGAPSPPLDEAMCRVSALKPKRMKKGYLCSVAMGMAR